MSKLIKTFILNCSGLFGLIVNPLVRAGLVLITFLGDSLSILLWNSIGKGVLIGWHLVTGIILFVTLDCMGVLRVGPEAEIEGLDLVKHKEPAYGFWIGTAPLSVNQFPIMSKSHVYDVDLFGNIQVEALNHPEM